MRIARLSVKDFVLFMAAIVLPCALILAFDYGVDTWFDHLS
jgi:hypothetical protein